MYRDEKPKSTANKGNVYKQLRGLKKISETTIVIVRPSYALSRNCVFRNAERVQRAYTPRGGRTPSLLIFSLRVVGLIPSMRAARRCTPWARARVCSMSSRSKRATVWE